MSPATPKDEDVPDSVQTLSPTFVEIYNQSAAAEAFGLTEIDGIGLRKALEFLVKDFAISQHPDKKESIEKIFLSNCIKAYIEDPNVQACAELATWLGNDEAHYVRKWEDKDIADLKRLIKLTMNWVDNVLETQRYTKEMRSE